MKIKLKYDYSALHLADEFSNEQQILGFIYFVHGGLERRAELMVFVNVGDDELNLNLKTKGLNFELLEIKSGHPISPRFAENLSTERRAVNVKQLTAKFSKKQQI